MIPESLQHYLNPEQVKRYTSEAQELTALHEKYQRQQTKLVFEKKLRGTYRKEYSLFKDVTPEDSLRILALLKQLKYNPYSFRRRGRGGPPSSWKKNKRHHVLVEDATRFAIYAYGQMSSAAKQNLWLQCIER